MNGGHDATPVVALDDVTRVYQQGDQRVEALRGLTMVVRTGEFTAISGPSGSGKTTALNLIGALDTPTSGTVRIRGRGPRDAHPQGTQPAAPRPHRLRVSGLQPVAGLQRPTRTPRW